MPENKQKEFLTLKHADLFDAIEGCIADSRKMKKTIAADLGYSPSQFSQMLNKESGVNLPAGKLWELMEIAQDFTPLDWMLEKRKQLDGSRREELVDKLMDEAPQFLELIASLKEEMGRKP